ncbi:MAG TPA: pyruvate kinase [Pseudogracilibacillus sp.]|nr:pyruvate kinase [Pseudogracilibacillus sp.]
MALKKTKIVCTIGPASESPEMLKTLIQEGMDVARLNFSHGDYEEHTARIKDIRAAANEMDKTIGILLDLQGPEIRTTKFKDGVAELVRNEVVYITMKDILGTSERFSVTYKGLINDVHVGTVISLDDGLIELSVLEIDYENEEIKTVITNGGIIKDKKGVNVPSARVNLPSITEKDVNDIKFGIEQEVDFVAASFVRSADDVFAIKRILEENRGQNLQIISKIENQEGVDNFSKILDVSYGIMVARGDLGVEIPAEDVPLVQKKLIQECNNVGKPVITATQMLDSMQSDPRPTRAEASDVANAILDGTDAIMLSGETAAGDFPVESVQTMNRIALKTESNLDHAMILKKRSQKTSMTITDAISQSVTHTASNLGVSAIITPTQSGHSARMVAKYRPKAPIIAVTFNEHVKRRLSLVWGIYSVRGENADTTDELLDIAVNKGLETKIIQRGCKVIITAGVPVGVSGTTNLMKVHVIGNVIASGEGVGRHYAYGDVVLAKNAKEAIDKMKQGDILVTKATDKDMLPAMKLASGIITEEGGLTSHAAILGLDLGIPVIVGVESIDVFTDGEDITIDGGTGNIYQGHASVL